MIDSAAHTTYNRAPVSQSARQWPQMESTLDRPTKAARLTGASASFFPRLKIALSPCASPLSFLGAADLARCESVSRTARDATRAPQLWTRFNLAVPQKRTYAHDVAQMSLAGRLALNNGYGLGDPLFFRAYLRRTPSRPAKIGSEEQGVAESIAVVERKPSSQ